MALTPEQFFGKIGVKNNVFSMDQLDECFKIQREIYLNTGEREPLSYILIRRQLMNREQMNNLLQEFKYSCMRRDDKELAQISVAKNFLTENEIEIALNFQRKLFRTGVGLFQLGEILISREILTNEQVFELSCELWLLRHPGKELPEHAKPKKSKVGADSAIESVSKKEVSAIKSSQKDSGFKICNYCNYKNPMIAEICYGCGEPLFEYKVLKSTDEKDIQDEDNETGEALISDYINCRKCGAENLPEAKVCFNCLELLIDTLPDDIDLKKKATVKLSPKKDSVVRKNVNASDYVAKKKASKPASKTNNEEIDEDILAKVNSLMSEITGDIAETKKVEKNLPKAETKKPMIIVDDSPRLEAPKKSKPEEQSHMMNIAGEGSFSESLNDEIDFSAKTPLVGEIKTIEKIKPDVTSKAVSVDSLLDMKTIKSCKICGYINPRVSPFCFGCDEEFEDI